MNFYKFLVSKAYAHTSINVVLDSQEIGLGIARFKGKYMTNVTINLLWLRIEWDLY